MSQQVINIGTTANDGTGDPLRTAWQKTNENFTEIYVGKCPIAGPGSTQAFAVGAFTQTGNALLAQTSGRVLVGTTTDDGINKLQVNGGVSFTGDMTVGGASGLTLNGGSSASVGDVDYLVKLQQPFGSAFGNNGTGILLGARTNAGNAYIGSIYTELTDGEGPGGKLVFATRQGGTEPTQRMSLSHTGLSVTGNVEGFLKANISNSVTPTQNYQMTFTMPGGDTVLRINVRGSDGITRCVDLTLTP